MTEPNKGQITKDDKRKPITVGVSAFRPDRERSTKLIVTSNVHYRYLDGRVATQSSRFARNIDNIDPVNRLLTIGEEWVELETFWIKRIGYLFLRNNGGKPFQKVPTEDEIREAQSKILEVGYMVSPLACAMTQPNPTGIPERKNRTHFDQRPAVVETVAPIILPLWEIPPGDSMQGKPVNESVYLRCQKGETNVTIFVLPDQAIKQVTE